MRIVAHPVLNKTASEMTSYQSIFQGTIITNKLFSLHINIKKYYNIPTWYARSGVKCTVCPEF